MVSKEKIIREATHYNSWYMGPKEQLTNELESYLSKAETIDLTKNNLRGMIVPHAGIMWSGPTAAWGFKHLKETKCKRIFIIGPSHFVEFKGCGLTTADYWETPFCNLKIDQEVYNELKLHNKSKKGLFGELPMNLDEYEHSLEIQTPYLGYLMKDRSHEVTIIPILTGKLSFEEEVNYAKILLEYYKNEENFFVISEDFCHWGKRHGFFFQDKNQFEKVHESIEYLDKMAFDLIKKKKAKDFRDYLDTWKNNLCGGGSPVTIYLSVVEQFENFQLKKIQKDVENNNMKILKKLKRLKIHLR